MKTEVYNPRLFWVRKEGKTVFSKQVTLALSSLNAGDCFVLDTGLSLSHTHSLSLSLSLSLSHAHTHIYIYGSRGLYGAGTKIVVFKGEEADAFENIKALSIAKEMESERHGKSTVVQPPKSLPFKSQLSQKSLSQKSTFKTIFQKSTFSKVIAFQPKLLRTAKVTPRGKCHLSDKRCP